MDEVCKTLAPKLGEKTLVLDTCSVKVHPVKTMLEYFSPSTEILATHPMFGPDSASKGLANLAMVLCPVRVSEEKLAFWYDYFTNLGLRVIVMSPEEHDLAAARTQGVTHFVGRFLAELGLNESPISTLGYRKIKEVMEQTCNDPWQLFLDLQNYNPYGASVRKDMRAAFDRVFEKAGFIDQAERL